MSSWVKVKRGTLRQNGLKRRRDNLPEGVTSARNGKFAATLKGEHLGTFESAEDASNMYQAARATFLKGERK